MTLRLLYPIAPAIVLTVLLLLGLAVFAIRVRLFGFPPLPDSTSRESSAIATPFIQRYLFWLVSPVERLLARLRVSPNVLTLSSLMVCGVVGVMAATKHFAAAAWLYVLAGVLDILDGRVARRTGRSSAAGAFLDSVSDRWGEFLAIGGIALALPDSLGALAVIVCLAGSSMVSYTRARGEALGLSLAGGTMQRGERMFGVSTTLLVGAVGRHTHWYDGSYVVAVGVMVIGVWAGATAVHRLVTGFRRLRERDLAATSLPAVRQQREQRRSTRRGDKDAGRSADAEPKNA